MIAIKDLYWLAGIIEGEGTFGYYNSKRNRLAYPRVKVKMTDEDVVRKCHEISGVGRVFGPYKADETRKESWSWVVQDQASAGGLMMTLYSLMGKRRQAKIHECLTAWLGN